MLSTAKRIILFSNLPPKERVINGTFAVDTSGWEQSAAILTVSSGALRIENSSAVAGAAYQLVPLRIGKEHTFSIRNAGATSLQYRIGSTLAGVDILGAVTVNTGVTASGITFTPSVGQGYLYIRTNSGVLGAAVSVDDISIIG